jgi:transcriptional regulator with XRE-family HTH domain
MRKYISEMKSFQLKMKRKMAPPTKNEELTNNQTDTDKSTDAGFSFLAEIGKRIAVLADKVGGKRELAHKAGIHEGKLYRYLLGDNEAKIQPIIAIAKAAGVSTDWLLTGEGPMQHPPQADSASSTDLPSSSLDPDWFIYILLTLENLLRERGDDRPFDRKLAMARYVYETVPRPSQIGDTSADSTGLLRNLVRLADLVV